MPIIYRAGLGAAINPVLQKENLEALKPLTVGAMWHTALGFALRDKEAFAHHVVTIQERCFWGDPSGVSSPGLVS